MPSIFDPMLLELVAVGGASGFIAGLVGLAGGIVVVPALTLLYGADALHAAIVISWFAVLFNSFSAAAKHWRLRSASERIELLNAARWYLLGVVLIAPMAAMLASSHQHWVTRHVVAVLQLCLAAVMFWPVADVPRQRRLLPAHDLSAGGVVAALSTLIGVGGGTYTIAYLVYAGGVRFRDAIATANVMGFAIGVLSVLGYLASLVFVGTEVRGQFGPIQPLGVVVVIASGAFAAPLGVRASRRLSVPLLRHILIAALAASAVRLLVS
jgi:uncharacterized protein